MNDISLEDQIVLDKFRLRSYQYPIWKAVEDGYKQLYIILPRRAGKDLTVWNLIIRLALDETQIVFYCLPVYSQAKRVIFDGKNNKGESFLSYIPKNLIKNINQSELKITLMNDSVIQLVGSDTFESSLVGTNPKIVVLSEYARCKRGTIDYISPILAANNGLLILLTTPYGGEGCSAWHLFKLAEASSDWFSYMKTTSEIKHIPESVLQKQRDQMSFTLYSQEYECVWSSNSDGNFYSQYLTDLRIEKQITYVPYEHGLLVHTAMDIGMHDATAILWYQLVPGSGAIRVIDAYSNSGHSLEHYIDVIKSKKYRYGSHFAPWDLKVREFSSGVSRQAIGSKLGIDFTVLDQARFLDGMENVYLNFNRLYIDETKCAAFIEALQAYRREWDEGAQIYKQKPAKHWSNHYADSLRYLMQSLEFCEPTNIDKKMDDLVKSKDLQSRGFNFFKR